MLQELESWRTQIQLLSHRSSRGYLSDRWVGMAYNYTILLLHQPTKENASGTFGDRSVKASVQIMLTFREFQKDRQTAQLWPGVSYFHRILRHGWLIFVAASESV
jgi:hypothetical protein